MIMNAYGLLLKNPEPSRNEIIDAMEDNLCRCGTYNRIIEAIQICIQRNERRDCHMKKDKYIGENINADPITRDLDRRDFLKRMGGGLLITFSMSDYPVLFGGKLQEDEKPGMNAYLRIGGG